MTGVTPLSLFYARLRQTGEIPDDLDDDAIAKMLAEQEPMGMALSNQQSNQDQVGKADNLNA